MRGKDTERTKSFMRSVLSLFLDVEKGSDIPPKPSKVTSRGYEDEQVEDEYEYREDTDPTSTEEHDEAADVISEIIDVEVKIAEMMSTARILDDYETDTVQNWDHRLGNKFPFMTGLRRDFEKAMITLANNHIVGVHLKDYFKKLAQYLDTLEVKTLINYLGWYFLREVADVLTTEVRTTLNAFLRAISKPGVAQQLNEDVCIEKLIGYHAKMEKGIAHLYLKRFFSQAAISKAQEMMYSRELRRCQYHHQASTVAVHLNASFTKFIQENSWMDEETRGKMSEWVTNIEYHMGAAETLLDEKYIRKQYDLVKLPEESSLSLYFFALMENNYLQEIRRYMTPYNRRNVWPSSVFRTEGRYSPHYTSLEMPAGALQDAIFKYYAPGYSIFGSMGTLTAEKLTDSFMEEGRGWMFWKGSYVWTEKAKRQLKQRLQCLRNEEYKNLSSEDRKKLDALDRFDGKGGESVLFLKFRDHVGLRTSYQAFASIVSECSSSYTLYKEKNEEMFKQFFYYYVLRNCGSDDPEQEHRVNFVLRTFTNFWSAFHCKDGDRMRREDNCHIMTSAADNTITSGQK
uniref:Peptidase M13 N-terminal domain-containing protein n=1 Tax=Amblyomma maculatum TaxID=34609 RepID=G3MTK0_AMBMU